MLGKSPAKSISAMALYILSTVRLEDLMTEDCLTVRLPLAYNTDWSDFRRS
jgi:hypothetical protein